MTVPYRATHYAIRNRKRSFCGRPIRKTMRDTTSLEKVSCRVCLKGIKLAREACVKLGPQWERA